MKFLKDKKQIPNLTDILHANMTVSDTPRKKHIIHASDVCSVEKEFCPREQWLSSIPSVYDSLPKRVLHAPLIYTFSEGRDKEARLQNEWLPKAVGNWVCTVCGSLVQWSYKPRKKCSCGAKSWVYEEVRLTDEYSGVSCGFDLFYGGKPTSILLIEAKIMGDAQFTNLAMPLAEHKLRTNMYLHVLRNSTHSLVKNVNTSYAKVLYMLRGHGKKTNGIITPFKEFVVEYDPSQLTLYLERSRLAKRAFEEEKPPEGICSDKSCPRASKCPVRAVCFSDRYPVSISY